jgi:putative glutamine amidotransferase
MTSVLTIGSVDAATVPKPFLAGELRAERTVREALESRGHRACFVDVAHRPLADPAILLAGTGGLVVLGGADVDPSLYGLPADHPKVYGVNRVADEFEIAVIRGAEELGIPILCICRGAQLLNVAHGGTLIPDIADWAIHHGPTPETIFVTEQITVSPDSRLATAMGKVGLSVQNGHHQAVDVVGSGLKASAWAADGIIEALESEPGTSGWVVGVQWHPEHRDADSGSFTSLFDAFDAQLRTDGSRVYPPKHPADQ